MKKETIGKCYVPDYRRTIFFNEQIFSTECEFYDGILCMLSCDVLELTKSEDSVDMLRCAECKRIVKNLLSG